MPNHILTIPTTSPYDNVCHYLSQTQALNLALWASGDVHEQLKPAFQLMDDLLNHIAVELDKMPQEDKGGQHHDS